jgi:AbrB family looped-hinge helix DNA binding protein
LPRAMVRLRDRNQITLPADVISRLRLKAGDWLELTTTENNVLQLRPAQIVTAGTPEAERQEKAALENLRRKNYSSFESLGDFDRHLDEIEKSNVLESPVVVESSEPAVVLSAEELKRRVLSAVEAVLQNASVK